MYYRRQVRQEYRRFTASTPIYAVYDDHDFGANDTAGGLDPFKPAWKVPVWRVFKENWNNPYYGGGEKQPGCWFDFSIGNVDAETQPASEATTVFAYFAGPLLFIAHPRISA